MTIAKATHFQEDFKKLCKQYGITSAFTVFAHAGSLHVTEGHVTERNPAVVQIMDGLTEALPKMFPDVPFTNFNNVQDN